MLRLSFGRPTVTLRRVELTSLLAVTAGLLLMAVSATAAPGDSNPDRVLGQGGSFTSAVCNNGGVSGSSLCNPWGVATDGSGRLYVSDTTNNRILIYDNPLTSPTADHIIPLGSENNALGIALDGTGRLYVVASSSHVLQFDTPLTSSAISRILDLGPGAYGIGIAIDSTGRLWVADGYNNRVRGYDTPVTSSVPTQTIPFGSGSYPAGVAVDAAGRLYASDAARSRVLIFDNPTTSSTPDYVLGQPDFLSGVCNNGGLSASSLCYPLGLAVDGTGTLFVSDGNNNRLLAYNDPFGACATCDAAADQVFGQAGSMTTGACNAGGVTADSMCYPQGVVRDSGGHLWVADAFNNRVLEFDDSACTVAPMPVSGSIAPGGTLSTGAGATPCQPMQASVTSPGGGAISVDIGPYGPAAGFLDQQVQISAPGATSSDPLTIAFTIDASIVSLGQDETTLQVFKNGAIAFDCAVGGGVAAPDPCVSSRTLIPGGDIQFVVLSSSASTWAFGPYTAVGGLTELVISPDPAVGVGLPAGVALAAVAAAGGAAFAWHRRRRIS
jgi:sugar lactone lactonase YvrE